MEQLKLTDLSKIDKKVVIKHVDSLLELALTAPSSELSRRPITVYLNDERVKYQQVNEDIETDLLLKSIYENANGNKKYRRDLISFIVVNSLNILKIAHRDEDLGKSVSRKLFNAKINEVLTPHQIKLWALKYEKDRNFGNKHSR